jgi:hypothetical protein
MGEEVRSSSDGAFDITLKEQEPNSPSRATLVLVAIHPTHRIFSQTVPSVPAKPDGALDVRLEGQLEVAGSAKLANGTPVIGATVRLSRYRSHMSSVTPPIYPRMVGIEAVPDEYVTKTGSAGLFKIRGVAPGVYDLDMTARGLLRQTSRNGVLDLRTRVVVPPSKTQIHVILEPCYYFALRPVDSQTGEPVRVARVVAIPTEIHAAGPELSEIVGIDRQDAMKAEGTFVGLVNASRRLELPAEVGFEAAGYDDQRFRGKFSPLPDPAEWPVNLQIVDVPMNANPLRAPASVAIEITGPAWVKDFRSLELFFMQAESAVNPTPVSTMFDRRVSINNGQGSLELLPGKYTVSCAPGYRRFRPVPAFEIQTGAENRLQLSAEDDRVPLRIRAVSPAEARVPLLYVVLRDHALPESAPEIMRALPDWDDPFSILAIAPPGKRIVVEVIAAEGPCVRGAIQIPPMQPGQPAFQDFEAVMEWAFP